MPRFKLLVLTLVAAAICAVPISAQPSTVVVAGHGSVSGGAVVTVDAFDANGLVGGVLRVERAHRVPFRLAAQVRAGRRGHDPRRWAPTSKAPECFRRKESGLREEGYAKINVPQSRWPTRVLTTTTRVIRNLFTCGSLDETDTFSSRPVLGELEVAPALGHRSARRRRWRG